MPSLCVMTSPVRYVQATSRCSTFSGVMSPRLEKCVPPTPSAIGQSAGAPPGTKVGWGVSASAAAETRNAVTTMAPVATATLRKVRINLGIKAPWPSPSR